MEYRFRGVNEALQCLCREILDKGVWRETRGHKCLEFPEPVNIIITNPSNRICNIKERKWNYILPYVESLWLALGYNNLDDLPGYYVKSIYNYSDDDKHWRAGYGSRLRNFNGSTKDYMIGKSFDRCDKIIHQVDQFKFIEDSFNRDKNTRQAGITIHDVMKDNFDKGCNLKITRDQPCTRTLQLQMSVDGKLNFTTTMRSNDLCFGFSHVNIFNFTFMQEYWSSILDIPMGQYYHFANNLHIYEDKVDMIRCIAEAEDYEDSEFSTEYNKNFKSLYEFDVLCKILEKSEEDYRLGNFYIPDEFDDFFSDWAKIFIYKNCKLLNKKFEYIFVDEKLNIYLEV